MKRSAFLIENLAPRRFWPRWKETLVIIKPDTVVRHGPEHGVLDVLLCESSKDR